MNDAAAANDPDFNPRPLRDRTDEALRVELAINEREAVQLVDPLLRRCAEVMLGKVREEMALRAAERSAPVPAWRAEVAELFAQARRMVRTAREFRGCESFESCLFAADKLRIEAKHLRWLNRPLERY